MAEDYGYGRVSDKDRQPDRQIAEIKKYAVVYIVGAIVLFASSAILGIIKDFAEKNVK